MHRISLSFWIAAIVIGMSAAIAFLVLGAHNNHVAEMREKIKTEQLLHLASTKEHVEEYFGGIHSAILYISLDPDVQSMSSGSRKHIQMLFEHEWERTRLAEIYVIERDFDGTHEPFMTFESKVSCKGIEEEHSLEFEGQEYQTQISQIQRFIAEPELKAQISKEIELCLRESPGQQAQGLVYSIPVKSDGDLVGIVAAMVTTERLLVELVRGLDTEKGILLNESNEVFFPPGKASEEPPLCVGQMQEQPVAEFFGQAPEILDFGDEKVLWTPIEVVSDQRWWLALNYNEKAQLLEVYGSTWSLRGLDNFSTVLVVGLILAILSNLAVWWNEERFRRLQEKKRTEEVLHSIVEGTSGKAGGEFFNSLVEELAKALGVKFVLVGELIGESDERIKTLAVWAGGALTDNLEYDRAGTPCEKVVGSAICIFPSDIQKLFPEDIMLQEMGAICYMGIPLYTSSGEAMGILAILDDRPLAFEKNIGEKLLTIFGARAASELETFRALRAVTVSEDRFRVLFDEAPLAYQSLDINGCLIEVNQAWTTMIGVSREEALGQPITNFLTPEYQEKIQARFPEFKKTGIICDLEFDFVRPDGSVFTASVNGRIGHNPDGSFRQTHCILTDITERKQAEDTLRKSEEGLIEAQQIAKLGNWSWDLKSNELKWSSEMFNIHGFDQGNTPSIESYQQGIFEEDLPTFIDAVMDLEKGILVDAIEYRYRKPNGNVRYLFTRFRANRGDSGSYTRVYGTLQDITERKLTEKAVETEKKLAQKYLDIARVMFVILDSSGMILQINRKACEILGYSEDELLGSDWFEVCLPKSEQEPVKEVFNQLIAGESELVEYFENDVLTKSGETRYIAWHNSIIRDETGVITGILSSGEDITDRRQAAEALKTSKELLEESQKVGKLGSYLLDTVKGTWISSDVLNELFGIPPDYQKDIQGWFKLIHPDDKEQMQEYLAKHVISQQQPFDKEYRIKRLSDGDERWVHGRGELKFSDTNELIQMIGTIQDITERKLAEEQLERLSTAIQQAEETVVITDTAGLIQYVNPAFCSITGYSEEDAIGQNPSMLSSGHHDEAFYRELWDTIRGGQPWHGRFRNKKKDGTLYHEEATISPVFDPGGKIINYVAVKRDVTHEAFLEEQLRQTQKMEAIGTLAGGIAHDFNNILFAILGYAELASDDIPKDHPASESLSQIVTAGKRAAELVKQILTFSRRADKQKMPIRVASIAKETVRLLRASLPTTIGINLRLNTAESTINADPTEIHQVIMNLCTNAGHAMLEHGGELEIGLSTIDVDNLGGKLFPELIPGSYLVLSVSDTGPGIPPDVLDKIFEPFFTTKGVGVGTGMGLAVVHGIILDLGGTIKVSSELGKGTSFKLYIPLANTSESPVDTAASDIPQGTERVLVIDDEPAIAKMLEETLRGLGYSVTMFTDSQAALAAYQSAPDEFDLVVTDQTMGQLTGGDLAKEILAKHPQQSIILCTGFSHTMPREKAEEIGITAYITKPVSKEKLAETVRNTLDKVKTSASP